MIIIVIIIIVTNCPRSYLKFAAWVCKEFEEKVSLRGYRVSVEKLSLEAVALEGVCPKFQHLFH